MGLLFGVILHVVQYVRSTRSVDLGRDRMARAAAIAVSQAQRSVADWVLLDTPFLGRQAQPSEALLAEQAAKQEAEQAAQRRKAMFDRLVNFDPAEQEARAALSRQPILTEHGWENVEDVVTQAAKLVEPVSQPKPRVSMRPRDYLSWEPAQPFATEPVLNEVLVAAKRRQLYRLAMRRQRCRRRAPSPLGTPSVGRALFAASTAPLRRVQSPQRLLLYRGLPRRMERRFTYPAPQPEPYYSGGPTLEQLGSALDYAVCYAKRRIRHIKDRQRRDCFDIIRDTRREQDYDRGNVGFYTTTRFRQPRAIMEARSSIKLSPVPPVRVTRDYPAT